MDDSRDKLWELCQKFITDQRISCPESVYQCDWVIENAYVFIEEICNIVGYQREEEIDA